MAIYSSKRVKIVYGHLWKIVILKFGEYFEYLELFVFLITKKYQKCINQNSLIHR